MTKIDHLLPSDYVNMLKLLRQEYDRCFKTGQNLDAWNPPKQSIPLAQTFAGPDSAYVNSMSARLSTGEVGTKIIFVNERMHTMESVLVIRTSDGDFKIIRDNDAKYTILRCALMAAFAVDSLWQAYVNNPLELVGFIGNGAINQLTATVLQYIFGVSQFVIRGSAKDRGKNFDKFQDKADVHPRFISVEHGNPDDLCNLKSCDIIISCTTSLEKNNLLSYNQLEGPSLFIAQDSGYILGPSFRDKLDSYSDYPTQLHNHWENEFPWDDHLVGLNSLTTFRSEKPIAVYLYGIAMADLVVALYCEGLRT